MDKERPGELGNLKMQIYKHLLDDDSTHSTHTLNQLAETSNMVKFHQFRTSTRTGKDPEGRKTCSI